MLREPKKVERPSQLRRDRTTGRFQLVRLEERIAPRNGGGCHYNPNGKKVGPHCY